MSLYNMLFGMNGQSDLLLAVIGFKKNDVERFRDVHVEDEGETIAVYARTGGGNRESYPQDALHASPLYKSDEDDDFDSTYATFYFRTPEEFVADVVALSDIIGNGLRKEFAQHLAATLNREPTDDDKETAAYAAEAAEIARTAHFKASGHTFVPQSDAAMEAALKLAEANGGALRSCWGILPIKLTVKVNDRPYPKAPSPKLAAMMSRVEVGYDYSWGIDTDYWAHCVERFSDEYPLSMAKIGEAVSARLERAA